MHNKANLMTPGCGQGKYSVYCKAPNMGPNKENRKLRLTRPKLPSGFQGRGFKVSVRSEDCRLSDQLMDVLLIG